MTPGPSANAPSRYDTTAAIDKAIESVEAQVRAANGRGPIYWNWYDIGATLRAARAQLENLPW